MNKETEDIKLKMSRRLITICEMLRDSSKTVSCVADVGCDHGYISIYLVQHGIADRAIAMDVRRGPLSGAESNIEEYGQQGKITTRLSDGLKELSKGEADTVVVAGMGGKLMIKIIEEGKPNALGIRNGILQPQSELPEFRKSIREMGYSILDERIIHEDGKYYFPMRIDFQDGRQKLSEYYLQLASEMEVIILSEQNDTEDKLATSVSCTDKTCTLEQFVRICNRFGEHNILRRDRLLYDFCVHGREVCTTILNNLDQTTHIDRYNEVAEELSDINAVLHLFDD